MNRLRPWLYASTALGVASVLALALCALALTDIHHGEADVRLEWWVIRVGFLVMALFTFAVFVTLGKVRRALQESARADARGRVAL